MFQLKARALPAAVVITTVVVILLATLQYRWSTEVSEATGIRLADTLQLSMVNWHHDFLRNFSEISLTMRVDPEREAFADVGTYAKRLSEWRAVARYPELVAAVHILIPDGRGNFQAVSLNSSRGQLPSGVWHDRFGSWSPELRRTSSDPADDTPPTSFAGDAVRGWLFEPDPPTLLHRTASGWIAVELNPAVIRSKILPDLAHRYFQGTDGLDYEVAVVAGNDPRTVLYTSDPGYGENDVADADGTLNVFGRRLSDAFESPVSVFHRTSQSRVPSALDAVSWFPRLQAAPPANDWRLIVRHRRGGPLGAFVADIQRRDLAISFGALLLLVASMGMLIAASNRAQRLARLQLDFVAAVSHELRTPLTVIKSAGDNLAQGVVRGQEQLTQYGAVIGNQVRQLSALIEEVLLFAATNNGQQRLSLRPLQVSEIIDATLASTDGLIRAAHFTVDRDVPRGLPAVMGDLVALTQVLQNLITNALKYSSDQRWLGIDARLVDRGPAGREIQISVSDRGIGIDSADLPRIFEPFYRGRSVTDAQIHGTGLGLTLAKRMTEAMKGHLTVTSEPGGGSTFVLHLSCADQLPAAADLDVSAPSAQPS